MKAVNFNMIFRPVPRLAATAGYAIVSATGDAPILDPTSGLPLTLNPNAPAGPLQYNYHKPFAGLTFSIARGISWRGQWSYYGYNEKEAPNPIGPRSFRANLIDLSVRYAF
jgi:hypothetical protein